MKIVYNSASYNNSIFRAIFSILLGVALVLWPDVALDYIVMLVGALFLITGLVSFAASYRNKNGERAGGLLSFSGIGSIILGLLLISLPSTFTKILMFVLGLLLIIAAVGQLTSLSMARKFGYMSSPVSYIFPVLIFIAGLVVIVDPFSSAESIFMLFGVTAIFYGITDLVGQYNINKQRKQTLKREQKEREERVGNQGGDVEDADYEEIK